MISKKTVEDEFLLVSKILYDKNIINIGIGSISLKLKADLMLINKKNTSVLDEDFSIKVNIIRENMLWEEASEDVKIHSEIYKNHLNTKAIGIFFLKETLSFIQNKNIDIYYADDYIGQTILDKIPVINIKNFQDWEENASFVISKHLENDILIIKKFGVVIKSKDIRDIIKKINILENSSFILNKGEKCI